MDRSMEMNTIEVHISAQKCDLGAGGTPNELAGIAAVEEFRELVDGVMNMKPEEKHINKMQPQAGLLKSRMKESLFKKTHEKFGLGRDHSYDHGSALDLVVMLGVER